MRRGSLGYEDQRIISWNFCVGRYRRIDVVRSYAGDQHITRELRQMNELKDSVGVIIAIVVCLLVIVTVATPILSGLW